MRHAIGAAVVLLALSCASLPVRAVLPNPIFEDDFEELCGLPCDGADTDVCKEGLYLCPDMGLTCTDDTSSTDELCNGVDDNCDGIIDEGFPGDDNPMCEAAQDLGNVAGDQPGPGLTKSRAGEAWFKVRLKEVTLGDTPITGTVVLTSPPGVDFDLYVYCASCGGVLAGSDTSGGPGGVESVTVVRDDATAADDDIVILIEVRYVARSVCADWVLNIQGGTHPEPQDPEPTCPVGTVREEPSSDPLL